MKADVIQKQLDSDDSNPAVEKRLFLDGTGYQADKARRRRWANLLARQARAGGRVHRLVVGLWAQLRDAPFPYGRLWRSKCSKGLQAGNDAFCVRDEVFEVGIPVSLSGADEFERSRRDLLSRLVPRTDVGQGGSESKVLGASAPYGSVRH